MPDTGRCECVVFLHGWGLGPGAYGRSLRALSDDGLVVRAPDLRLPGRHWSDERVVERVVTQIDRLERPDVAVVGHSLGGAIAVRVVQAVPERVAHLIVVDSIGLPTMRTLFEWATPFSRYATAGFPTAVAEFLKGCARPDRLCGLVQSAMFASHADLGVALDEVGAAGVRSTVVWGKGDRLLPLELSDAFARRLRTGSVVVVDGDHDWPLRRPRRFAHIIEEAVSPSDLQRVRPGPPTGEAA